MALPTGGTPWSHLLSSRSRSPPQSETLKGGLARMCGPQVGVLIVVEAVAVGNLGLDAPDRQVHLRQPPGGVVGVPLRPVVGQGHFPALPESCLVAVLTRPSGSALWG